MKRCNGEALLGFGGSAAVPALPAPAPALRLASVRTFPAERGRRVLRQPGASSRSGSATASNQAAIAQLIAILQRAPFDGLASGPAARRASPGRCRPGGERQARRCRRRRTGAVSAPGSQYVQAVKKPTAGMIYAYPVLQPQGSRADQILLTAAAAPSLEAYLVGDRRTSTRSTPSCATPPGPRPRRAAT